MPSAAPRRAIRVPASGTLFRPGESCRESRWVDAASFPVQECGVPRTEVQEHRQAPGGPSAGLQPRSVPGAEPRGPRQKRLRRCGSGLVLIALATGGSLTSDRSAASANESDDRLTLQGGAL